MHFLMKIFLAKDDTRNVYFFIFFGKTSCFGSLQLWKNLIFVLFCYSVKKTQILCLKNSHNYFIHNIISSYRCSLTNFHIFVAPYAPYLRKINIVILLQGMFSKSQCIIDVFYIWLVKMNKMTSMYLSRFRQHIK